MNQSFPRSIICLHSVGSNGGKNLYVEFLYVSVRVPGPRFDPLSSLELLKLCWGGVRGRDVLIIKPQPCGRLVSLRDPSTPPAALLPPPPLMALADVVFHVLHQSGRQSCHQKQFFRAEWVCAVCLPAARRTRTQPLRCSDCKNK